MKDNLRIIATHLLILILGCILFILVISSRKRCAEMKELKSLSDTVVRIDTLRIIQPIVRDSMVVRFVKARVPVVRDSLRIDSVLVRDTTLVELPITQKRYTDSTYTAWVSGYDPRLDSIHLRPVRTVVTIRPDTKKPRRWQFGLQGGVGMTPKGVQPYIGVGFGLRLF